VRRITEALPRNCEAAIIVVFHVGAIPSQLPEILSWHGKMPVLFAKDGATLEPGRIYVAPRITTYCWRGRGVFGWIADQRCTTRGRLLIHCLHRPRLLSAGASWASS